jgi:hypothetical protein
MTASRIIGYGAFASIGICTVAITSPASGGRFRNRAAAFVSGNTVFVVVA